MRSFSKLGSIGGALAGAVLLCACQPARALDPPRADAKSDRYRAAYQIAAARCDRRTPSCESQTGDHYDSREACIAAKLPASATEADLGYCASYSLREYDLDACLTEIRSGQCGTGISNISACRGRNLCPWDSFEALY